MADTIYKAFFSCSFAKENAELNEFFERLIRALGFEPIIYNYQEIGRLGEKVEEKISRCDCLIAVAARSKKVEGTEFWACSDWIYGELTLAHAYQKPIAIFCEDVVKLEGLIAAEERRQVFSRNCLLDAVPEIVQFLFNLRSYLAATAPNSPVMLRHYVHVHEEVKSAETTIERVEVLMECLADKLEATHHWAELEDQTPGLSVRPEQFDFLCKEAPFGTKVEAQVVRSTDEGHLWRINFSPPLKRGEKVRYAYKSVQKNNRPWTLAELNRRIAEGTYKYEQRICEACEWSITYPTVFV